MSRSDRTLGRSVALLRESLGSRSSLSATQRRIRCRIGLGIGGGVLLLSAMVAMTAASAQPPAHPRLPVVAVADVPPSLDESDLSGTDSQGLSSPAVIGAPASSVTTVVPGQSKMSVTVSVKPPPPTTTVAPRPGFVGLPSDANIIMDTCALLDDATLRASTGWSAAVVAGRTLENGDCTIHAGSGATEATLSWSAQAATSGPIATIFAGGWGPTQPLSGLGARAVIVDQDFLGMVAAVKGDRAIWVRLTGTSGAARTATLRAVAEAALVHL